VKLSSREARWKFNHKQCKLAAIFVLSSSTCITHNAYFVTYMFLCWVHHTLQILGKCQLHNFYFVILLKICTRYSPDRPANNSGFHYSPDNTSMYLQRTCPGPVSLIAINIQPVVYLSPPKPLFCSRVPFRSFARRSVVPTSRGYRPLINPTTHSKITFIYNTMLKFVSVTFIA